MKTITLCIALLSCLAGWAQPAITLLPATITLNEPDADLDDKFLYLESSIRIKNETADTLQIIWRRETPADCPESWQSFVSDINISYMPTVSTNYDPTMNIDLPFSILPGDTVDYFSVDLMPRSTPGCCIISLHFSELAQPDEILATAEFEYRINDPFCQLVAVTEAGLESHRIVPNPTTGICFIKTSRSIGQIDVFSGEGMLLRPVADKSGRIDLSDFPPGLYLVRTTAEDGRVNWQSVVRQ